MSNGEGYPPKGGLQEPGSRLRTVLSALPDLMFQIDPDGTIRDFHALQESDLLLPPERFLYRNLKDVLPAPVASKFFKSLENITAEQSVAVVEYYLDLPEAGRQEFEAQITRLDTGAFLAVIRNTSAHKTVEHALRSQDSLLQGVAASAACLLRPGDLHRNIEESLGILGRVVRADRVYVFENHFDRTSGQLFMSQRYEWVHDCVSSQIDNPELQNLPFDPDFTRWRLNFESNLPVSGLVKDFPEGERAILQAQDILSLLVVPIWLEEQPWGFVGFDDCHSEHLWREAEVSALQAAAGNIGGAIVRFRSQEAQQEGEELLKLVLEGSDDGFWDRILSTGTIRLSARMASMLGEPAEEFNAGLGAWLERIHPADRTRLGSALLDHIEGRTPQYECEYRARTRAGAWKWLLDRGKVVTRGLSGDPERMSGTTTDIDARKQAEEKLRLSEERLRTVVRDAPILLFAVDLQGRVTLCEGQMFRTLGISPEEILGRPIGEKLGHIPELLDSTRRALAGQFLNAAVRVDNFYLDTRFSPVRDLSGALAGAIGVATDITEIKRVERALMENSTALSAYSKALKHLLELGGKRYATPEELCAEYLREGCALFSLSAGIVCRMEGEGFAILAAHGSEPAFRAGQPLAAGGAYCAEVARQNRILAIHNAAIDAAPLPAVDWAQGGFLSFLGAPILVEGDAVGVLGFLSRTVRLRKFSDFEVEIIHLMALWIGRFIENFQLENRRREAEEALRQNELKSRKLALVASRTESAVIIANARGEIEWVNEAFTRITEYTLAEAVGKRPGDLLQGPETDPRTVAFMRERLRRREGFVVEFVNYAKSGRKYWIMADIQPSSDENGTLTNFIAVETDITERKLAEENLARAREHEVEIGYRIQQALLQGKCPRRYKQCRIAALSHPSQRIDGDFYDFISFGDQILDVTVGDVMGKGVPAALLGAGTKSEIQRAVGNLLGRSAGSRIPSPAEIVNTVHQEITGQLISLEAFVTLCYARLDFSGSQLRLVDCGHTKTIHYRAGERTCQALSGENMPLGFTTKETYTEIAVPFQPDDVFFFYSDGVTEARNQAGEYFGQGRLTELIRTWCRLTPAALIRTVSGEVCRFTGSDTWSDDFTCLVVRIVRADGEGCRLIDRTEFPSRLNQLSLIRSFLRSFLQELPGPPVDEEIHSGLELALNEAAANIIKHAYHEEPDHSFLLELEADPTEIAIRLTHTGEHFKPEDVEMPDFEGGRDGGFGLFIIRQIMDDVEYRDEPGGRTVLTMRRRLRPTP